MKITPHKYIHTYQLAIISILSIIVAPNSFASGVVKQPKGWGVQYVDGSCVVHTDAAGAGNDPPWFIKMGYLHGDQLRFMFSASNANFRNYKMPIKTKAWLVVDGVSFTAINITYHSGQFVIPVENRIKLQNALSNAHSLGIKLQEPRFPKPVDLTSFTLANISGAMDWLKTCSLIGVGALP